VNIGIFACDPGGATGLAWGICNPDVDFGESLLSRTSSGSMTIKGDVRAQIRAIAEEWRKFYQHCVQEAMLPHNHVWYVCEDYIYHGGVNYSGESAKISTALIWGVEGYRMGRADQWSNSHGHRKISVPPVILQTASSASGYATDARLKNWGLWVKGRDHERSAWRHFALFLQKYMQQHR
jgi:hypothetical protein